MKHLIPYIALTFCFIAPSYSYSQTNIITASSDSTSPTSAPNTLITKSGKQYVNYQIVRADPDGLNIKFSTGIAKIPFEELPEELQAQYHFNTIIADQYRSNRAAQQNAYAQKQRAKYLEQERQAADAKQIAEEKADREATIRAGKIMIGMTKSEVLRAWGKPDDINRTVGEGYGTSEQWVYGHQYVYIDNGVVTA